MIEEAKDVGKVLKELGVSIKEVKSIEIKYKKVLENKAFPVIKITLKDNQL